MNIKKAFVEYIIKPEVTFKILFARALLISIYTIFTILYSILFWFNLKSVAIMILLPFILFGIIKSTWLFVSFEYEISIISGEFSCTKIFGKRFRGKSTKFQLKDCISIMPYDFNCDNSSLLSKISDIKYFVESFKSLNAYIFIYKDIKQSKTLAVVVETNEDVLQNIKSCNPSVFKVSNNSL